MTYRLRACVAVLLTLLVSSLVACADEAPATIPGTAIAIDDPFSGGYPAYDDEEAGLRVVLGTPDLGVGPARLSFAIFDRDGVVSMPSTEIDVRFHADGPGDTAEVRETVEFTYRAFPDGGRGLYVGHATFDADGLWSLAIPVALEEGTTTVVIPVEVAAEPAAPAVGDPAPASHNRTSADEPDLARLTTASEPDARLYQLTVAEALAAGEPIVLVFTSPAFCTTALCGPQVDVLSALADDYDQQAAFIHVDLYENPTEIRGDLSVARRTPVLDEWGLQTDQWTFVIDSDGIVRARIEGFAPREELEAALLAVIAAPGASTTSGNQR